MKECGGAANEGQKMENPECEWVLGGGGGGRLSPDFLGKNRAQANTASASRMRRFFT